MVDALRTRPKHCPFLAQGRKLVEGSGAGPYLEVDRTQFRGSNAALSPSVLDPEPTKTACSRQAKFRSATGCCRSLVVLSFGSAQEWVETPHARLVGGSVGAVVLDTPNVGFDWAEVRHAATARTDGEKR